MSTLLYVIALVLFVMGALGSARSLNIVSAGMACLTLAWLIR